MEKNPISGDGSEHMLEVPDILQSANDNEPTKSGRPPVKSFAIEVLGMKDAEIKEFLAEPKKYGQPGSSFWPRLVAEAKRRGIEVPDWPYSE
jgi:hypothetical protein